MKKISKIKRLFVLCLIFLLSINSFAAIVADNDGATFITKAEFDSLKNNFQAQINNYNMSIDSKIEGAIASYLAGIRVSNPEVESDAWIYNLLWYNKLPTVTYNSSYCTDSTNPHKELRKNYSPGMYANSHTWAAYIDDYGSSDCTAILKASYTPPNSGCVASFSGSNYIKVFPNELTDDTYPTKDNASYVWSDGGGSKKVFERLDYYHYVYWNITATAGNNNITSSYSAADTCPWDSTDDTEWPKWYFEFDAKGYPKFTTSHWYWRGTKNTVKASEVYFSPTLLLQHSCLAFGTYDKFMLGQPDTSTHSTNPIQTITEYKDGLFDIDAVNVKCEVTNTGNPGWSYVYEHDATHPINLNTYVFVYPSYGVTQTDVTTSKIPEKTRNYKHYEWDSTKDKTVVIKGFRPKLLRVDQWYNKYSMDYEPLMLYEGAPVMQTLSASGMYKVTIKTNASAQVNLKEGKFAATTTGNGNSLKRYNEDGTENGYAQNMACNTTLTFYIKGEKGMKYYCRINPTSTGVNSNVKITSFKYQQIE